MRKTLSDPAFSKLNRTTQRRLPIGRADDERLVADVIDLTRQFGQYDYRRTAALLRNAGWHVKDKRVEMLRQRARGGSEYSLGHCFPDQPESTNETPQKGAPLADPLSWFALQTAAGQWMGRVSGFGLSIETMSDRRTSCIAELCFKGQDVLRWIIYPENGKALGPLHIIDNVERLVHFTRPPIVHSFGQQPRICRSGRAGWIKANHAPTV